jgi:hypothetical protein
VGCCTDGGSVVANFRELLLLLGTWVNTTSGGSACAQRLHCWSNGMRAGRGLAPSEKRKGGRRDHTHREELEAALKPLERVDTRPHLPPGLPPVVEPELEAGRGRSRVVRCQPKILAPLPSARNNLSRREHLRRRTRSDLKLSVDEGFVLEKERLGTPMNRVPEKFGSRLPPLI